MQRYVVWFVVFVLFECILSMGSLFHILLPSVLISPQCENWSKNMIHSSNLLTNEHHTLAMREPLKFDAVPKLVLAELLHRWVKQHATVELSTERTEELVALAREPLPRGRAHKTIAVSKQYAVVRWHKDLRLTLRHPSPGS